MGEYSIIGADNRPFCVMYGHSLEVVKRFVMNIGFSNVSFKPTKKDGVVEEGRILSHENGVVLDSGLGYKCVVM